MEANTVCLFCSCPEKLNMLNIQLQGDTDPFAFVPYLQEEDIMSSFRRDVIDESFKYLWDVTAARKQSQQTQSVHR